jgi:hypothetical protein
MQSCTIAADNMFSEWIRASLVNAVAFCILLRMRLLLVRNSIADVGLEKLRAAQGNLKSTVIQLPTTLTNSFKTCSGCRKHVEMIQDMPMLQ